MSKLELGVVEQSEPLSGALDAGQPPAIDDASGKPGAFKAVKFLADSALLRELGERLVGQPHIALAELIKNAYDADALNCQVHLGEDDIVVRDNGHGMSEAEFLRFWMTIGTRNKQSIVTSRDLGRPITGSKGVGRLAAQFLAHEMELITASAEAPDTQLRAKVDWDAAVAAGSLTEATALYRIEPKTHVFPNDGAFGTVVTMKRLKQVWSEKDVVELAKELWLLQPPFADRFARTRAPETPDPRAFQVQLTAAFETQQAAFNAQMRAALDNWDAQIDGEITRDQNGAKAHVSIRFRDGNRYSETYTVDPLVGHAKWHIRVYNLQGRQMKGVKVSDAREYFEKFGGVQIYDAGFRLPYYGAQQDWLDIEYDHAHRRSRSHLLPERLQVTRALNDLPSQGRLFGVVSINTGREAKLAEPAQVESGEYLKIQISRDRLVTNEAYRGLRDAVRWSIDYYATRQRLREEAKDIAAGPKKSPVEKVDRVRAIMAEIAAEHPEDTLVAELAEEVNDLEATFHAEKRADDAARALLGPLASAGMAALAIEHESRKEIRAGRALIRKLRGLSAQIADPRLTVAAESMEAWIDRLEAMRALFSPLLDEEDREAVDAFQVRSTLQQVVQNVQILTRGVRIDVEAPRELTFPPATFAEWNALLQNVIINAANATLDSDRKVVRCSAGVSGRAGWVRISDTGAGIDLAKAPDLFEPFARQSAISEERQALGLGGLGLGLTIVRMIATQRRCKAAFVEPEDGFATTFQLSWSRQSDAV